MSEWGLIGGFAVDKGTGNKEWTMRKWLGLVVMAAACWSSRLPAQESADEFDGEWHVYDLPRVTQIGDGQIADGFYNPSVIENGKKRHPFGQPNSHAPWLHPGGVLGDRRSELVVVRSVRWPRGRGPEIYQVDGELPQDYLAPRKLWTWHYPRGTAFRVELFGGRGRFALHEVVKTTDEPSVGDWDENHATVGQFPDWYSPPGDCRTCHQSAGRHARVLEPKTQDYYHWLRGSADGRFSWHPFMVDRSGPVQQVAVIRPGLRRFVRAK